MLRHIGEFDHARFDLNYYLVWLTIIVLRYIGEFDHARFFNS